MCNARGIAAGVLDSPPYGPACFCCFYASQQKQQAYKEENLPIQDRSLYEAPFLEQLEYGGIKPFISKVDAGQNLRIHQKSRHGP